MVQQFEGLNDHETELMLKAPILVCILIAGADGTIDRKEIDEAIAIARKQTRSKSLLTTYFEDLYQDFEDKLKVLIQSYPHVPAQRASRIERELSELNTLWFKLDHRFAKEFYEALKKIAGKIASSSGGLLGMNSIGSEEAKYVQLSMINDPGN